MPDSDESDTTRGELSTGKTRDDHRPSGSSPTLAPSVPDRSRWTSLSEDQLLTQCLVDTYRASGPGGQKRNKTSSAVRLRHEPSGLIVIAEESRSQHENKAKALRRLRRALFLYLRRSRPLTELAEDPEFLAARTREGRLAVPVKDARFWPAAGVILDALQTSQGQVRTLAEALGLSTANVIDFLASDPKLWQEANRVRVEWGLSVLRR